MNASSVRPQTKFAAALVAASVVAAASLVAVPENHSLPVLNIDVAEASVITDALYALGGAVDDVAYGAALTFDAPLSLPFDSLSVALIATQAPSLAPNLLSWLVQRYANPSDLYPNNYTYPWDFKISTIEPLASLLPSPIGSSIIDAVNQISDAINNVFAGLPAAVDDSVADAFWASDIGRTVLAANFAVTAPVWMLFDTATYLGYLPYDLEATVESAIQNPSQLPGLVSNLVYGLASPNYGGLLGSVLYDASAPFTSLPGPIGELANNVVTAIYNGINGVLSLLPAPISPNPLLATVSVPSAATSVEANSLPQASLAVAGGITLKSADPVEKKVDATDSTLPSVQDPGSLSTPPTTPKDPAAAAGDVKPVATPAADPDAPKTGADTSVTNPVTSGNKVNPGDKFDNGAKGETAKDNGAGVSSGAGGAGASDAGTPDAGTSGAGTSGAGVSSGAGGAGAGAGASGAAA